MRRKLSGVEKYCWPVSWVAAEHVPQPELGLDAAVALAGDAAGDQRLGVDGAPVGKARRHVGIGDLFDEGGGIDRREQAAALEIRGDDLGNAARRFAVGRTAGEEIRQRDRQRLDIALVEVEAQHRARRPADSSRGSAKRRPPRRAPSACAPRRRSTARPSIAIMTSERHGDGHPQVVDGAYMRTVARSGTPISRGTCRSGRI